MQPRCERIAAQHPAYQPGIPPQLRCGRTLCFPMRTRATRKLRRDYSINTHSTRVLLLCICADCAKLSYCILMRKRMSKRVQVRVFENDKSTNKTSINPWTCVIKPVNTNTHLLYYSAACASARRAASQRDDDQRHTAICLADARVCTCMRLHWGFGFENSSV